jgi:UPF0755 protein
MKLRRALLALPLLLAVVAAGTGAFLLHSLSALGGSEASVLFRVEPGVSLGTVARDLESERLIRHAWAFKALARSRGLAGQLRAGEYDLSPLLSAAEILERIAEGRVRTYRIAIPEGLTAAEIAQRLEESGLADATEFLAAVRNQQLVDDLDVEGESLEGYLFPETYHLARGLPAEEIARAMVTQFHAVWREIAPRSETLGFSMLETVTLASIIEKETGAPAERPLISAVFHNRLRRGMRLDSDPTVIYGIPRFDGNLRRVDLEDARNPYNTYQISGLPPGPIANPGAEALRAAVEPADANYLYFVSRNDGTHEFSSSYAEHVAAVDRYQRRGGSQPRPQK